MCCPIQKNNNIVLPRYESKLILYRRPDLHSKMYILIIFNCWNVYQTMNGRLGALWKLGKFQILAVLKSIQFLNLTIWFVWKRWRIFTIKYNPILLFAMLWTLQGDRLQCFDIKLMGTLCFPLWSKVKKPIVHGLWSILALNFGADRDKS